MTDKHVHHHHHPLADAASPGRWKLAYWVLGIGSLIWLLLRSGTKPKRLAYPCQQAAAANGLGFLAYLAALLGSAAFLRRLKQMVTPGRLAFFACSLLLTAILQGDGAMPLHSTLAASPTLPDWTSPTAVSNVFAITNVPAPEYSLNGGAIPSGATPAEALHDDGVDALVNLMEGHGDYFYKTTVHPGGLFGTTDVVVIKVNNQWDGRNGANTDVVKGVVYRLVQHPEGFSGAVIIAENSQGTNDDWYNQPSGNNSQFQDQSYQEVAQAFAGQGYHVCISDWKAFRDDFVSDYDAGNTTDGYVLDAADNKLSYPKFGIDCGGLALQVSMKNGLWNGTSYDASRLKMINLPVLKRHNAAWATIAVKNYLGFVTLYDGIGRWSGVSEKHCWLTGPSDNGYTCTAVSTEYGLIGRQMARIRRADLDIVDAIWVNPRDNSGWHGEARRLDVLMASRDPFAVDYYASEYVLYPLVQQYGSTTTPEQARAGYHGGWFRNIQLRNVARLRAEGVTDTINMDDSMTLEQELAQFNAYVADANAPPEPTVTLTVPNGGESWEVGTQHAIQWSSTDLSGNVKLEYSIDNFGTPHEIVASTADDGSYTWTIPNDPSANAGVRVSSVLTPSINDTSNAVFSIVAPTPVTPTLTLAAPNGGESWEVGTQHAIQWSSTNLSGDVKLEYSIDNFSTPHEIVASTADDGSYAWTVPSDPSANARVRVSSVLTPSINDASDAVFTIAPAGGVHLFEDSFKTVSHEYLQGGEVITYTIVLYEATSANVALTDTIPAPCTYVTGSVNIEPAWKGTVLIPSNTLYWSGVITSAVPVTITFQVQVPVTTTVWVVANHALASRNGAAPLDLTAISFLNRFRVYLPIVLKQ